MIEKLEEILQHAYCNMQKSQYAKTKGKMIAGKAAIIAGKATASYLSGLTTGGIGKNIGGDLQYAIPIAPLILGFTVDVNWTTIFYALGVATNYRPFL